MKRVVVLAVAVALTVGSWPVSAAGPATGRVGGVAQATGVISGTAMSSTGQILPNATVPLRNLYTGQIAGLTTSDAAGSFRFVGVNPGTYVVEVVNHTGTVAGSSGPLAVIAGATATVSVRAMPAAAFGGQATTGQSHGVRTAVIITTIAAAAGIAAAVAIANNGDDSTSPGTPTQQSASPSR